MENMNDERAMEIFMDIQRGLPRQGPGHDDETRQALGYCLELPDQPSVLDIGCGPGMQTLVLAGMLHGSVTAIDLHQEYLDELQIRSDAVGRPKQPIGLAHFWTSVSEPKTQQSWAFQ